MNTLKKKVAGLLVPILLFTMPIRSYAQIVVEENYGSGMKLSNETVMTTPSSLTTTGGAYGLNKRIQITTDGAYTVDELIEGIESYVKNLNTDGEDGKALLDLSVYPYAFKVAHIDSTQFDRSGITAASYQHNTTRLSGWYPQADIAGRAEAIFDAIALGEDASGLVKDLLSTQTETGYFKDPKDTNRDTNGIAQAQAILALEAYYGTDVEVEWPNYEAGKDYGYIGALKKLLSMQKRKGYFTGDTFNSAMSVSSFSYAYNEEKATQLIIGVLAGHVEDKIVVKENGSTLGECCKEAIDKGIKYIEQQNLESLYDVYYMIPTWIALGQPEKIEEHNLLNALKFYRNKDGSGSYSEARDTYEKFIEYDTQQVLIALSDLREGEVSWRRIVTPRAKATRFILETLRGLELPSIITTEIHLPTEGVQGTNISWESSHEEIITSHGRVVQPSFTTQVTLTATFTNGEVNKEKNYVVTVKGSEKQKEEIFLGKAFETFYNTYEKDISSLGYTGTFVLASSDQNISEYTLYDVKKHKDGDVNKYKAADYAGVIMQLILEGKNPYYYEGINYVALLENYLQSHETLDLEDERAWAVLALDAAGAKVSQEQINQLIEMMSNEEVSLGAKGLSLVALMQHKAEVGEEKLGDIIKILQTYQATTGSDAGTFKQGEKFDLDTHAYVVMGLVAAGEDLSSVPYIWEEKDPIDGLGRELEKVHLPRMIALGDLVQESNVWQRMNLEIGKVKVLVDQVKELLKTDLSAYDEIYATALKLAYDNVNTILESQGSIKGYGGRYFALQQALKDLLASSSLTEEELYTPESYRVYKEAKTALNILLEQEEITTYQLVELVQKVIEAYNQLELKVPQESIVPISFTVELEAIGEVQKTMPKASSAQEEAKRILDKALQGMEKEYGKDISRMGYWGVFRLAGAGVDLAGYKVYDVTTHKNGIFANYQATDYAAIILQLVMMGENPYNYKGINYVEKLQAIENESGAYGPYANNIWALYALDAAGADYNEALVSIVKNQAASDTFDLDMRGWALIAIQNHRNTISQEDMQRIIDSFKKRQVQEGEYRSTFDHIQYQNQNINTHSCVVSGLVAAGEDVTSEKWTIDGQNPLDIIGKAQLEDGSFILRPGMIFKDFDKDAMIALGDIVHGSNVWQRQYLTSTHLEGVIEQGKLILEGDVDSYPKEQVEALRWAYNEALRVPEGKIKGYGEHYFRLKEAIEKMSSSKLPYFTDGTLYTTKSFKVFVNEAMALTIVSHNPNATAHEIYTRCQAIILAHQQLEKVSKPDPDEDKEITVTFELIGDSIHDTADKHTAFETWIKKREVTVPEGSVVFDVFDKALGEAGIAYEETQPGYIGSIKSPSGQWLSEFTNGVNSGWMYMVNGIHPMYGLRQFQVYEGDHIVWHYTDDYTKEEGSEKWNDGGSHSNLTEPVITLKPSRVENGTAFFSFTQELGEAFIAQLQKDNTAGVMAQIHLEIPDGVTSIDLSLPRDVMNALGLTRYTSLKFVTKWATFIWDEKVVKQITKEADHDAMNLSLTQVETTSLSEVYQEQINTETILELNLKTAHKDVSDLEEEKLQIRIPYELKKDQKSENLKVYYVSEEGELQLIEGSTFDKEKKEVIFLTSIYGRFAVVYEEPKEVEIPMHNFTDISTSWAKDYIEYLVARGIVEGKTKTSFAPNELITRAEFVQILFSMSKVSVEQDEEIPFIDVQSTDWFMPAVVWAKKVGIVIGDEGYFKPQETITRQDMALMLYRYIEQVEQYTWQESGELNTFVDDASIKGYAKEAIYSLQRAQIIMGREKGFFAPLDHATRAEVCKMMALTIQRLDK